MWEITGAWGRYRAKVIEYKGKGIGVRRKGTQGTKFKRVQGRQKHKGNNG